MSNIKAQNSKFKFGIWILIFGIYFALLFLISSEVFAQVIVDRIAAVVNNRIITLSELDAAIAIDIKKPVASLNSFILDNKRKEVLQDLIGKRLLLEEATRFDMTEVSTKEIKDELLRIKSAFPSEESFNLAFKEKGMGEEDLLIILKEFLIAQKFVDQRIRFFVRVGEEEIRDYYEKNREKYKDKSIEAVADEIQGIITKGKTSTKLRDYLSTLRVKADIRVNLE